MRMARADMLIAAGFTAIAALYVGIFHYRAPYFDHWDLARLLEAADAGGLTAAKMFELHGGHWHAGGYALLVPLAQLTGWSHLAETMLSVGFAAAICALSLLLASRFAAAAPRAPHAAYAAVAAFFAFSLDQASNLLWGFQLSVFVSQFGVFLGIAALTGPRLGPLHVLAALAGLSVAATSYATGFALAPIGLALIALHDAPRVQRILYAVVWSAVAAALCIAFARAQLAAPAGGFDPRDLGRADFLAFLALFEITYLGAGVSRFAESLILPAAAAGLAFAGAGWATLARRGARIRTLAIPLALCAHGLGAGLLCAVGRYDFGAEQGANARYISFSNAFWLGAAMLALALVPHVGARFRRAAIAALVVLALLKTGNCIQSAVKHAGLSREIAAAAQAMRADPSAAASVAARIASPQQDVAVHVAFLREKGWSVFRQARRPASDGRSAVLLPPSPARKARR